MPAVSGAMPECRSHSASAAPCTGPFPAAKMPLSPPIAGERLMPAPPTLTQPAGDWINPGSAHAREPAIAAGLPVAAEDGGAIAVLRAQNFAARGRRFPVRLLSFGVVVLVPAAL